MSQTPSVKPEEITFSREQFYEKIWAAPATQLAKEIGLSDVMIGKICKEYDIPKPYPGYWAKLRHGKSPKKSRLPKNDDSSLQQLTFFKYPHRELLAEQPEPEYDPDILTMLDHAIAMEPVKVSESLRKPHALIEATREQLKRDQVPYHQRPRYERNERQKTLDVHTSKALLPRALRIMDAVIKRIEKIGGSVEIRKEQGYRQRSGTIVSFGGEDVTVLRLREKQNQVKLPKGDRKYEWRETELQPSGLLVLDSGSADSYGILLRDTEKKRRIEDGLNDLIIGFIRQAGDLRIKRRRDEELRRQREEQERIRREEEEELRRRRADLERRQKAEQARVDELVQQADSWQTSIRIREYLSAVCDHLLARDGAISIDGEAADYLRWAHQQADRLDPLRLSAPSVLDDRI